MTDAFRWRNQPENFGTVKLFDFSRATVFCWGYRLSKHKMTRYSEN